MDHRKVIYQVIIVSILTIIVYFFYNIKFVKENIEDYSFDFINQYVLSTKEENVKAPNLLLFKIDDKYLESKKLLDSNGELNYGYLFPRRYIAEIINTFDELILESDKKNIPQSLFIDYDMSYTSEPNNILLTEDDILLLDILKKERPYKIYLPKTSNYNFIEESEDIEIKKRIKSKNIVFVSVSLSVSSSGISRRYYPYEEFFNKKVKTVYPLVDIQIFKENRDKNININKEFFQEGKSLIENRIIFKEYSHIEKDDDGEVYQSNWTNFRSYSASIDLFSIPEENFSNSIIYIGGTHSNSEDIFTRDTFSSELSGIEMHANALMTLFYLDGKLQRLGLIETIGIIAFFIFLSEVIVQMLIAPIFNKSKSKFIKNRIKNLYMFFSTVFLFGLSSYLIQKEGIWLNWMIPSLLSTTVPFLLSLYSFTKKLKKGKN